MAIIVLLRHNPASERCMGLLLVENSVCGSLCILARFPFKANGGLCVLSLCFCASHSVYG